MADFADTLMLFDTVTDVKLIVLCAFGLSASWLFELQDAKKSRDIHKNTAKIKILAKDITFKAPMRIKPHLRDRGI